MSDIFLVCMMIVKGCQTLVMGPTRLLQQPLVEYSASLQHAALILSLVRVRNPGFDKNLATTLTHIIDVWHLPSVYDDCEGLSDLGNGPN